MFDRLQKPFLTVETGEAYQPIRMTYDVRQKDELLAALNKLQCLEKNPTSNSWNWFGGANAMISILSLSILFAEIPLIPYA